MTDKSTRARVVRFLDQERRQRVHGLHRAVEALHRRAGRPAGGGRLRHYLRIERGRSA